MARWTTVWEKESGKPFRAMVADVGELTTESAMGAEPFYTSDRPTGADDAERHKGEVVPDPIKDAQDLNNYTIKDLRTFATDHGINNADKMKKLDLIAALKAVGFEPEIPEELVKG